MADNWEVDSDSSASYQAAINNSKMAKAQQMLDKIPDCLMWTEKDTANWVEKLGFPYYRACFEKNLVSGKHLILMDASALPKIGITDFQHIKVIAKGIRDLLRMESPDWQRSICLPPKEHLGHLLETKGTSIELMPDKRTWWDTLQDSIIDKPPAPPPVTPFF